jgi:hypothetical protein
MNMLVPRKDCATLRRYSAEVWLLELAALYHSLNVTSDVALHVSINEKSPDRVGT